MDQRDRSDKTSCHKIATIDLYIVMMNAPITLNKLIRCHVTTKVHGRISGGISSIIGPNLAARLQSIAHRCKVASLCLFYKKNS